MKKGCLASLIVIGLLISPFFIHPFLNNRKLNQVETSFARLRHPPQSTFIHRVRDVGLLIGNSNHCDFFAGELRAYSGTQQQVSNFYTTATVWSPISKNYQPLTKVIFLRQGVISPLTQEYLPYQYRTSTDWSIQPGMKNKHLYIVYFLDVGTFNQRCDLRCN